MHTPFPATTKRALRTLALAYLVQATGALSVVGSLEAISGEWGLNHAQAAWLITAFGVTFAVSAPLQQVILGHLNRRTQVLLGLSLFSAAALACAMAPTYAALLVSRIVMGFGAGLVGPVLGALGSGLVKREDAGSAIAVVLLGLSISGMVGIPVSAWIAGTFGPRLLFLTVGVSGIVTIALIVSLVPANIPGERITLQTVKSLLTEWRSLSAFLVVFFIAASVYATYALISPVIVDVYHGTTETISAALTVLGVAGVLGNLFVTRASRRYGAVPMLAAGMTLLAADIVLLWWTRSQLWWFFAGLVVWAFATDILWPSQQRRIVELTPHLRGIALAVTASFLFCGIGFGSAVAGWIYPSYGYAGLLASSQVLLSLAALSLWMSKRPASVPTTVRSCSLQ